ncbi:hypothetical protein [Streptomyces barringtoniae]|uniref:hypothetical protein n=1 Tax=Streptomyces barringtoniae TaxID=2892029 RepID=UPI001E648061|nr:hypothetical protein [Streptomyces barringtoniae]MCC5479503.1 hypothetical protein [Streptomyces barringtoniae]
MRVWAACVALLAAGAAGCGQSTHDGTAKASAPAPRPTVTVTATTTVTARPEPGPTVTRTKTVRTPGPTVTVTKAASGTVRSDDTGTCSIVSNAGNCYRSGQFCRSSDHGATTTTASGTPITCSYSGSAWRWTYA